MQDLTSSQKGVITELLCQQYLISQGFHVLVPISNDLPYDLVIEKENRFYRIQCKHASGLETGFKVYTSHCKREGSTTCRTRYEFGMFDYLMTTYKDKYYIFPYFGTVETRFWTVPPAKNNPNCKLATDFLAEDVLKTL